MFKIRLLFAVAFWREREKVPQSSVRSDSQTSLRDMMEQFDFKTFDWGSEREKAPQSQAFANKRRGDSGLTRLTRVSGPI
jgi:hypothetical protein